MSFPKPRPAFLVIPTQRRRTFALLLVFSAVALLPAAYGAQGAPPPSVDEALTRALNPDPAVRTAAAAAMAAFKDDSRVTRALKRLLADTDGGVRQAAANALAALTGKGAWFFIERTEEIDRLVGEVRNATSGDVATLKRVRALETLSELHYTDPRAIEAFEIGMRDPAGEVRHRAIAGLAKQDDPRHAGVIIDALRDKDPWVRSRAAKAAGGLGDRRAVEPLLALLEDPLDSVRTEAWSALTNFTDKDPRAAKAINRLNDEAERALERMSQARLCEPCATDADCGSTLACVPAMRVVVGVSGIREGRRCARKTGTTSCTEK